MPLCEGRGKVGMSREVRDLKCLRLYKRRCKAPRELEQTKYGEPCETDIKS